MKLTKGVKLRRNSVGLVLKETVDVQNFNREKCNYLKWYHRNDQTVYQTHVLHLHKRELSSALTQDLVVFEIALLALNERYV